MYNEIRKQLFAEQPAIEKHSEKEEGRPKTVQRN